MVKQYKDPSMPKFRIAFCNEEMKEDILHNTSIIYCIERGMNEDGIRFWKRQKTIRHEEIPIRHLNQKASSHNVILFITDSNNKIETTSFLKATSFAVSFDDYQHVDEILPDHNNYPEKTGNLDVNNFIFLLPEFYTFDSAHNCTDPEQISVNMASFDDFLHIVSIFQNPTEHTKEVRRQAPKIKCILIQNVHDTILLKSNDIISTLDSYLSLNVGKVVYRKFPDVSKSKIVNTILTLRHIPMILGETISGK